MACFFLQLPLYVVFKPSLPLFQVMTTKKTNLIFSTANQMMPPLMSNWPKPPCEVCEVYAYFLLCISCRDKSIILPSFCCNRIFAYFGCETNSLHNLIGSSVRRGFNALKAHKIISQQGNLHINYADWLQEWYGDNLWQTLVNQFTSTKCHFANLCECRFEISNNLCTLVLARSYIFSQFLCRVEGLSKLIIYFLFF